MNEKKSSKSVLKIIIIIAVVLIFCLFLLVMCSGDDEEETSVEDKAGAADFQATESTGDLKTEKKEDIINGGKPYGDPDTSWTVLLYLCGTDLETKGGFASVNLEEITNADLNDNINFVIEAGGTKKWQTGNITNGKLSRLHVENGGLVIDEKCPSASMGDSGTLKDFIKWGAEKFPADRYALVLWDHGGGSLFGVCTDELYNDDCLTLKEIESAVVNASVPFELAGFDACLMSTLETAEALQGYAHYMVASEETEPGTGWDYTAWLNYLSKNAGCNGQMLGKTIVDSYMKKCGTIDEEDMATLSVSDLTKLPVLSAAFKAYSGELVLTTQNASDLQTVVQGASQSESYGERSGQDGTYDMVDLGDLMDKTGGVITENSQNVLKALKDVIVYESHGIYRSKATGLAVFFPKYIDSDIYQAYADITDNTAYLEFASVLNDDWDAGYWDDQWQESYDDYSSDESSGGFFDYFFGSWEEEDWGEEEEDWGEEEEGWYEDEESGGNESGSSGGFLEGFFGNAADESSVNLFQSLNPVKPGDEKLEFKQFLDDDNILNLNITSGKDLVKDVRFCLIFDEDGENMVYMGCDTDLNADYDKGEFSDNFRGTWITIGGEFVCAEVIDRTDDYDLYIVPAVVNGDETFIRAVYEYDSESFKVLGTYDGSDEETGLSGRDIHPLKAGDKVEFIFYTMNINDDDDADAEEYIMGDIVWSDDTKMTDEEMGDGSFYYMFEIEDIFGNVTDCDPVVMEIENGEISAYEIED